MNELSNLFAKILDKLPKKNPNSKMALDKLINTTLWYRDNLKNEQNRILTIDEVKLALNEFEKSIFTHILPKNKDKIILDLIKLWHEELKLFL